MVVFRPLKKKLLRRINREVRACHKKKIHRPTAAIALEHVESGLWLVVYSNKCKADDIPNPGIVKGGIDPKEGALKAALRELVEEIQIDPADVVFKKYGGAYVVPSQRKASGFAKKRYFMFYAQYFGSLDIQVNNNELSGHIWCTADSIETTLAVLKESKRNKKHTVLVRSFQSLIKKTTKTEKSADLSASA